MCNPDDSGHCDPDILRHHVSPLQTLAKLSSATTHISTISLLTHWTNLMNNYCVSL